MVREILILKTDNDLGDKNPTFLDIEITEYTLTLNRMGVPSLKASLMFAECLDNKWTGREYVMCRGQKFYLHDTPSSSKSNTDVRYKHELVFKSEVEEVLGNVYFFDVVRDYSSTADKPCSNSTTVKFYGTITEFIDRLNCSFHYDGIGDSILNAKTTLTTKDTPVGDGFCAVFDPDGGYDAEESLEVSFTDQYIWNAITEIFNIYKIPFELRGKQFIFGASSKLIDHTFRYGCEHELLSVSKTNANAKIINRITMLGSSENIPHYYPNETEYGHIELVTDIDNKHLTKDMVKIVNMSQLLAYVPGGEFAILRKNLSNAVLNGHAIINTYHSSFGDAQLDRYIQNTILFHESTGRDYNVPWHVGVNFKVVSKGVIILDGILGRIWSTEDTEPSYDKNMILHATPEIFEKRLTDNNSIITQIRQTGSSWDLGELKKGNYYLQFRLNIPNRTGDRDRPIDAYCSIKSVSMFSKVESISNRSSYYWSVGDNTYIGLNSIGLDFTTISDDMIGDKIGWTAYDRMPFQEKLMPSKYRETVGAERFYNALNDTYVDPETGNTIVFPNPYIKGKPREHIFENDKRKPTIAGMRNDIIDTETGLGQLFGEIAGIAYDKDDNDSLKLDSEGENQKNDSMSYEHSYFYIRLNKFSGDYGFNLFDRASQTDAMTLQMTSGSCNGCKFKIQAVENTGPTGLKTYTNPIQTDGPDGTIVDGNYQQKVDKGNIQEWQQNTQTNSIWICVQKDASTFGSIMPNREHNYLPKVGDTFNIINIDLPQSYMLFAEKKLEEEGLIYMADNNEEKFNFSISASSIFFAQNPDILQEIDEYCRIHVYYNGKIYERFISSMTIECKNNTPLPNIRLELADTLVASESFAKNVALQAASLVEASMSTNGYSAARIRNLLSLYGRDMFLSKTSADRTPYPLAVGGRITAEEGIGSENFTDGMLGFDWYIDPDGNAWFKTVNIRESLIVPELKFNRAQVLVGTKWCSNGGGIIETVTQTSATEGEATLRLEAGDFGAIDVSDRCLGFFHFTDQSDNYELNSDKDEEVTNDNNEILNFNFKGFTSIYFEITEVSADHTSFKYKLRDGYPCHPAPGMSFAQYSTSDETKKDRQKLRYETPSYVRYLDNMTTWEIKPSNIMIQLGDLSNLIINGKNFDGYAGYMQNVYFTGIIQQIRDESPLVLTLETIGSPYVTETETCKVIAHVTQGFSEIPLSRLTFVTADDVGDEASYEAQTEQLNQYGYFTVDRHNLYGQESLMQIQVTTDDGKQARTEIVFYDRELLKGSSYTENLLVGTTNSVLEKGDRYYVGFYNISEDGKIWHKGDKYTLSFDYEYKNVTTAGNGYIGLQVPYYEHDTYQHYIDGHLTLPNYTSGQNGYGKCITKGTISYEPSLDINHINAYILNGATSGEVRIWNVKLERGHNDNPAWTANSEDLKGQKGDSVVGPAGAVKRGPTEWVENSHYYDGKTGEGDFKYLDWVYVRDAAGNRSLYQCKSPHISSASNAPGTSGGAAYWQQVSDIGPLYSSTFFAPEAKIDFFTGQEIIIHDGQGKVKGAISGGDMPIYMGGATSKTATYKVDSNGKGQYGADVSDHIEINPSNREIQMFKAAESGQDVGDLAASFHGRNISKDFNQVKGTVTVNVSGSQSVEVSTGSPNDKHYSECVAKIRLTQPSRIRLNNVINIQVRDRQVNPTTFYKSWIYPYVTAAISLHDANNDYFYQYYRSDTNRDYAKDTHTENSQTPLTVTIDLPAGEYELWVNLFAQFEESVYLTPYVRVRGEITVGQWSANAIEISNKTHRIEYGADGFIIGNASNNNAAAYIDSDGNLNAIFQNPEYGLQIRGNDIKIRHHGGKWNRMPMPVFRGCSWKNGSTWEISHVQSVDGNWPSLNVTNGVYQLSFPAQWAQLFPQDAWKFNDYWRINVRVGGTVQAFWSVNKFSSSGVDIHVMNNQGTGFTGNVWIEIEYLGVPDY